ncbi:hypothetical protein diail_12323 [Diaporthe ilicicola]|nr:hypothetical protein diail_12323 [Diaporthe ilicicola]
MTSFTPLSLPVPGLSFQNGHFGDDVTMRVRGWGSFVSTKWKSAPGEPSQRKSMMSRLSKMVHGEDDTAAPAQMNQMESGLQQPDAAEPSPRHRRFSLPAPIANALRRSLSLGSDSSD